MTLGVEALLGSSVQINPYPTNVDNMVARTSASKWRMGFNSAFKGLNTARLFH
jgi:hypothetical protein